jgi:hypothetical protein
MNLIGLPRQIFYVDFLPVLFYYTGTRFTFTVNVNKVRANRVPIRMSSHIGFATLPISLHFAMAAFYILDTP